MRTDEHAPRPLTVVVHDYLTQRGGAERVALAIAAALEPVAVVTSVYSPERTFAGFGRFRIVHSVLATIPLLATDPRRALPLLPWAWSRMPPLDADVVVCSSSGWAHGVPVTPTTRKVVYCHNPPRWLYQRDDYLVGQPFGVRLALAALRPFLLRWDRRAAASADLYLANSTSVAARIREAYGIEAQVLHPPVSLDADGVTDPAPGVEPGYFLTVGRARGYKGTELLVDAFRRMPQHRLVVVGVADDRGLPPNVVPLGQVGEERLRWLYANAKALVSVSREDFGLTPIEANAFGTPALVVRDGGFLDSTAEGVSGRFIESATVPAIVDAVTAFPAEWDREAIRGHAAGFGSASFAARLRDIVERAGSLAADAERRPGPVRS